MDNGKLDYCTMVPKFDKSFDMFDLATEDFKESMWNYMSYGLQPGGLGMSILLNDLASVVNRMHPALQIDNLKDMINWVHNVAPPTSFGSTENINKWENLSDTERRDILIKYRLRPSVIEILRGEE